LTDQDSKELTTFFSEFKQFQGQMLEFKQNTERRLDENRCKLELIESKISQPSVCQFHNIIASEIDKVKDKNVEHDKKIAETEKVQAVQEFQLKGSEKIQLNVASIGTVVLFIVQVLEWVTKNWKPV
jgi:hypothetical protein